MTTNKTGLTLGFLLMALIVYLSLTCSLFVTNFIGQLPSGYEIGHIVSYAILMLFFSYTLPKEANRLKLGLVFIGIGVGLEFLQELTPDRAFEFQDIAANTSGVIIGGLLSSYSNCLRTPGPAWAPDQAGYSNVAVRSRESQH